MSVPFELRAVLPVYMEKDSKVNQWVCGCAPLRIATQARTEKLAEKAFSEALELWIESCLERDTLVAALKELKLSTTSRGRTVRVESFTQGIFMKITRKRPARRVVRPSFEEPPEELWCALRQGTSRTSLMTCGISHAEL
jgi:predicted RNase H-like HicB family nuclease